MGLPRIATRAEAPPEFLALACDERTRQSLRQAAGHLGWPSEAVRDGGAAAARALLEAAPAPGLLVVDVSDSADPLHAMDALAEVCDPQTRVIALGEANDVALYRELMRLGVSDYLVKPLSADAVLDAVHRVRLRAEETPSAARAARTCALIGARGGVGTTSLAVSLAWALAGQHRRRTVLLDLDLQFGAAALSLDLDPGRGLKEILSNPERIDSLLIGAAMVGEASGLRLLAAEEPLEDEVELGPAGLGPLLAGLSETAEAVVLDLPRRLDRLGREALVRADVVGVVTDLTLAGMRDTQRLQALLKTLRPAGELRLIANRAGGAAGELPRAEFERGVGAALDVVVPFDAEAAKAAAEQAKSLLEAARNGPAANELRRMAALLAGEEQPAAEAERTSWVRKLLRSI